MLIDDSNRTVDKAWFHARFQDADISQRSVAARMGLNHASLSQMMAGRRRPQIEEVIQLASICRASVHEVIRRLGYIQAPKADTLVTVSGYVDGNAEIIFAEVPAPRSVVPPEEDAGLTAVRLETDAAGWQGWHLFYHDSDRIDPSAVGTLAVVRPIREPERRLVRQVFRSAERDRYDLRPWPAEGARYQRAVELLSATPVRWLGG